MTDNNHNISDAAVTARESARQSSGQFGAQQHTAPDETLAPVVTHDNVAYGIYQDGALVSMGQKGAGMGDALHRARVHASSIKVAKGQQRPVVSIRAEDSDVEVTLPYADQGRIVGWHMGSAVTAEELDARKLSLPQLDTVSVEPFIDLGPDCEGELYAVEQLIRDGDFHVSDVYARRDEETGGRHVDVTVNENFLWNAETQCPDDEYDDDSDLDPTDERPAAVQRYEAWLDKHEAVVKEVYLEWFNADIYVSDTWENATVTLRTSVPYERFTESLVLEDVWSGLVNHANRTDPGTWNSPYVMGEVRRRVEQREAED